MCSSGRRTAQQEGKRCPLQWLLLVLLLESFVFEFLVKKAVAGNSLVVQWVGLLGFLAEGPGSVPGGETETPQATCCSQREKQSLSKAANTTGSLVMLCFFILK